MKSFPKKRLHQFSSGSLILVLLVLVSLMVSPIYASPNDKTESDLSSTANYSPVSGVNLSLSYNVRGSIEGSSARPGESIDWEFGVRDSEVEISLSIDKWLIDESWTGTVDFEIGSSSEIDVPYIPGVSIVFEFDISGDFEVVTGPANLGTKEIEFNKPGEKSSELDIYNDADGGDEIRVVGEIYPRGNVGLKIDLTVASKTFEKSFSMNAMDPSLEHTVYIPCRIKKEAQPTEGGFIEISPAKEYYDKGEQVTIVAHPKSGYEFDQWSGDVSGASKSVTVTMDSDKSVTANFNETGGTQEGGRGVDLPVSLIAIVTGITAVSIAFLYFQRHSL